MVLIQSRFLRLFYILTTLFLLYSVAATCAYGRDASLLDDTFVGIPNPNSIQIETHRLGNGHLRIHFFQPAITLTSVSTDGRDWTLVELTGETRLWQTGKPSLPAVVRPVLLPNTGNVEVRVLNTRFHDVKDVIVYPEQPLYDSKNPKPPFAYDDKTYTTNSWYPALTDTIGEPAIMRDARIAPYAFYPVQYNPVTRVMRIHDEWEIEIIPIGGHGTNELTSTPKPVPSFAPLYGDILGADELVLDNLYAPPGQILIIANFNTATVPILRQYADWKTATGHPTQLYTPGMQIYDPNTLKSYIQSVYNSSNPPLESVILVGDGGTLQSLLLPSFSISSNLFTDHPYSQLAGNDILADVIVSRFSTSNIVELQTMVNRTMNYERNPPVNDSLYFTSGWGYAGISHGVYSNRPAVQFMLEMMQQRGISRTRYDEHGTTVDYQLIQQATSHTMLWAHRAAWVGELNPSNFLTFNNPNRPFIALNMTCGSGDWYGPNTTGINEALIRYGSPTMPSGALCGLSTEGHATKPAYNNVIATGAYYGFGVNGACEPGAMYLEGKFQLWRNFQLSSPTDVVDFSNWNNAMGDVTPHIWTAVPHPLQCNIPASLPLSRTLWICTVTQGGSPVPKAMVTAWKRNQAGNNETYLRLYTDSTGSVLLPLTNQTPGSMILTVTGTNVGQNFLPIVDTVTVTGSTCDLQLNSVSLTDDTTNGRSGNGDNTLNPGEIADLRIQLTNLDSSAATIAGALSCSDLRVQLSNYMIRWDSLGSGQSRNSNHPVRIALDQNFADKDSLLFVLQATNGGDTSIFPIVLPVRSLNLSCQTIIMADTFPIAPGTSASFGIAILNTGGWAAKTPTTARLVSRNPNIIVTCDTAIFDSIPINWVVRNRPNSRWSVTATNRLDRASTAAMMAIFRNGAACDTVNFQLPTATVNSSQIPSGPDCYGYRAYDWTDRSYPAMPSYNWFEIIENGLGQRLSLNDTAYNCDTSLVLRLPFTVRYYGKRYDSLTICSNGWVAFGKQPQFDNFRNWHLPAPEGPRNLVAVFWEDILFSNSGIGQGAYFFYDTLQHQYVITWRALTTFGAGANEFQLVIRQQEYWYTPTGDAPLLFQYKSFHNMPGDDYEPDYATIGIADNERRCGLEYTFGNRYTTGSTPIPGSNNANTAILFTTAYPDSFLHVLAPCSRDTLSIGIAARLAWCGRPGIGAINIDLNRNYPTGTWDRLFNSIPNTGSVAWMVNGPATTNARFRIINSSATDGDTTGPVVIRQATMTLTVPHSTDTTRWAVGDPTAIEWSGNNLMGTVSIYLKRDYPTGGWQLLFSNVLATSRCVLWTVTGPLTNHARLQILSTQFGTIGDTTGVIAIVPPAQLIVAPNPLAQVVASGDTMTTIYAITNSGGVSFNGTVTPNCGVNGFTYLHSTDTGGPVYEWEEGFSYFNMPYGTDNFGGPFALPFSFPYFGQSYNNIWIGTNGWISLTEPRNAASSNQQLPYTVMQAFLAVFWDHLTCPYTSIKFTLDASRVIVSWTNVQRYHQPATRINFEAILYPNGTIVYQYGTIAVNDTNTCVSMQSADLSRYFNVYHREPIPQQHAIKFFNSQPWAIPIPTTFSIPAGTSRSYSVFWNAAGRAVGDTLNGTFQFSGNENRVQLSVPVQMVVQVNAVPDWRRELPKQFELYPCYPNPFNPTTEIRFDIANTASTRIDVFDVTGRKTATLCDEVKRAGRYGVRLNGAQLAAGMYFVRLQSGANSATRKVVLVK